MPLVPFSELPDGARVWVFAAPRPLSHEQARTLLSHVDKYLDQWKAHGAPLRVARDWRYEQFLVVGVDEAQTGASGCSIDGLVRTVRDGEKLTGVTLTDNAPIWFKRGTSVESVSRPRFRELAEQGTVDPGTIVFDNTVATVGDYRAGRWEVVARDGWHGRVFFGDRASATPKG